jgi:CRISPR-associated endonuclease/helicase Cas3
MMVESYKKNQESGVASELIRDVWQVQILIHDDPNDETDGITKTPWLWESFALHPYTLMKWWKAVKEIGLPDGECICQKIETYTQGNEKEPDNKLETRCRWVPVKGEGEFLQTTMIVIPKKLASYDDDMGFMLLDGTTEGGSYQSAKRSGQHSQRPYKGSHQRSYQEHIFGLLKAYESHIQYETFYVVDRLEQAMSLPPGTIDHARRMAIACHDLGKLDQKWQQWARNWQAYVKRNDKSYEAPEESYFFAKTDYDDTKEQREAQRHIQPKRPHHACESVMLGRILIGDSLGVTKENAEKRAVLRATCAAIARHHTSQAEHYKQTKLNKHARTAVEEVLQKVRTTWSYDIEKLDLVLDKEEDFKNLKSPIITLPPSEKDPAPEEIFEFLLYCVIVRALRLADQRADIGQE